MQFRERIRLAELLLTIIVGSFWLSLVLRILWARPLPSNEALVYNILTLFSVGPTRPHIRMAREVECARLCRCVVTCHKCT